MNMGQLWRKLRRTITKQLPWTGRKQSSNRRAGGTRTSKGSARTSRNNQLRKKLPGYTGRNKKRGGTRSRQNGSKSKQSKKRSKKKTGRARGIIAIVPAAAQRLPLIPPGSRSSSKGKSGSRRKADSSGSGKRKSGNKSSPEPPEKWWRRWIWYANPKRFLDWWFTKQGFLAALKIAAVALGLAAILLAGLFFYFARDLPNPGEINAIELEQTTKFYDRTGDTLLYEVFGDKNRTFVEMEEIGDNVKNATVAMENRNFYEQSSGISTFGILRAATYNVLNINDSSLQGGSTITQQYVKNALLSPERTISRKIKEIILSIQIEQLYSKDDILELYLNEIPYGAQAYGVQAASRMYFSKEADQLDLDEAAMLAALPQAPSYYSPYGEHTEALNARIDTVLELMAEQGYVSQEETQEAIESDTLAKVNNTPDAYRDIKAPHFVLSVQRRLEEKYGTKKVLQGGLEVITTINMDKQRKARRAVRDNIHNVVNGGGNNAALVATNPNNGQVVAMVGSRGFDHKQFGAYNAAAARRQPGSSFKPYVYAKAFEGTKSWGAGSIVYDVRTDFGGGYVPNNFDNSFRGAISVRSALAESRNIPAVKMLYIVGLEPVLKQVKQMGITTLGEASNYGLSLVLGSGEVRLDQHVHAYEAFANGGSQHEQTRILKVTEPDGTVLQEWQKTKPERVFSQQTAYLISDILSDEGARAPTFGYNNPDLAVPGHTVAIKTGTTDDLRDGWMMGYSRDLVAGVWTGHHQNEPMHVATSNLTGPIFTQFMRNALENNPNKPFDRPDGIKHVKLDAYTGNVASDQSRKTVTDIFPSWYEPATSDDIETATINTATERKINDRCRAHEDYTKKVTSYGLQAEIPPDDPAFPRWNPPVEKLADRLDIGSSRKIPDKQDNCNNQPEITTLKTEDDSSGEVTITVKVDQSIDEINVSHNGDGDLGPPDSKNGNKYTFTHKPVSKGDHDYEALVINEGLFDRESDTCKGCGDEDGGTGEEGGEDDDGTLGLGPPLENNE